MAGVKRACNIALEPLKIAPPSPRISIKADEEGNKGRVERPLPALSDPAHFPRPPRGENDKDVLGPHFEL